jgi:protein-tyrosine phosphatase
MLDLHCHILPGVDDGAVDLPEALAMARAAVANGCTGVAATSHLGESLFDTTEELLRTGHIALVAALEREGVALEVHPGAENFLGDESAAEEFAANAVGLGVANRYVLFDFSLRKPPDSITLAIDAILRGGRTPILAHPERNLELQKDPSPIAFWIERGALMQVNAPSLLGTLGEDARATGFMLLAAGAVHLLASDAHNLRTRPFCLAEGRDAAAEIVGEEEAMRMVNERPWKVVRGEPIQDVKPPAALTPAKRGFFSKLWSRGSS